MHEKIEADDSHIRQSLLGVKLSSLDWTTGFPHPTGRRNKSKTKETEDTHIGSTAMISRGNTIMR